MLRDSFGASVLEVILAGKCVITTDKKNIREREHF